MARILIVEDNTITRDIFRTALIHAGHEVVEAVDGDECLVRARDDVAPDLILLDFGLPKRNGLDCLKILKFDERTQSIPVIVVTAYNDIELRIAAATAGCDGYLEKPVNPRDLVEAVALFVGKKTDPD